jgi:cation transport ATPase
MKRMLAGLTVVVLAISGVFAADNPAPKALGAGTYSANVTGILCSACPPEIEKTLKAQSGVDKVSVDQKTSTVQFTIKPGAKVQLPDLQKALKAASDQMGMGADYRLKNLKKAS